MRPYNEYNHGGMHYWYGSCPNCGKYLSFAHMLNRTVCTWCRSWMDITWDDPELPRVEVSAIIVRGVQVKVSWGSLLRRGRH